MAPLFQLRDVHTGGPEARILKGVNLILEEGGVTCVAGPSGSGKTSLLRLLNRLDVPSQGAIVFRDQPIDEIDPLTLRRQVAMVFQRPPVFPGSVLDNLLVADPSLARDDALAALARADLGDNEILEREADTLSGGEAQRMCLARGLLTKPEVLLADEPTSSLDQRATVVLEDLLRKLAADRLSVILVSHDLDQLERMADRVVVMEAGRILARGSFEEIYRSHDPAIEAAIKAEP